MSIPGGGSAALGSDLSPESAERLRAYYAALADEDARRFGVEAGLRTAGYRSAETIARMQTQARIQEAARALRENRREFDLTHGLETQRFGLERDKFGGDILFKGASLRGPIDAFQGASYARGVAGSGLAPYLQSLRGGGVPGYGGGTATQGNPMPLTVQTMANESSGQACTSTAGGLAPPCGATGAPMQQGATGASLDAFGRPALNPQWQERLGVIEQTAQRGLGNLQQGALENMTGSELDTFKSGLSYLGRNPDDDLEFYKRSRAGQGSSRSA